MDVYCILYDVYCMMYGVYGVWVYGGEGMRVSGYVGSMGSERGESNKTVCMNVYTCVVTITCPPFCLPTNPPTGAVCR